MKVFLLVASLIIAVTALPVEERISGVNGWYVPQADGSLQWINKEQAQSLLIQKTAERELPNNVRFFLFTKANPNTAKEILQTKASIDASNFNPAYPVKFVIHGWTCNYLDESNLIVRDAWLKKGNYNIISVDWERARSVEYVSSVLAMPVAGQKVAAMLNFIQKTYNIPFDKFEVIGHSLGAHVAGHTGKNVKNGQVYSIVGLDPAMPLISYSSVSERLAPSDARYVESIQTNGGKLGFLQPIGTITFYPNGGKNQPGCGVDLDGMCAHKRSYRYYAEAIERNNYPSYKCASYNDANKRDCGTKFSTVRMSQPNNAAQKVTGVYYPPLRSAYPWGYDG